MSTVENDDDILIDPNDFKSMELRISLENISTQTSFQDGKRSFGNASNPKKDKNLNIKIVEFLEKGLIIQVPPFVCAATHIIRLEITPIIPGKKEEFTFEAAGKVEKHQKLEDSQEQITVVFTEYKENDWTHFKNFFSARQEAIFEFLKAVKGM